MSIPLLDIYDICKKSHDDSDDFISCGRYTHVSTNWQSFKDRLKFGPWEGDRAVIEKFYDTTWPDECCDTAYMYHRMSDGEYEGVALKLTHDVCHAAVSAFCTRLSDGTDGKEAGTRVCLVGGAPRWEDDNEPDAEITENLLETLQRTITAARQNLHDRYGKLLPETHADEGVLSGMKYTTLLTPVALLDRHQLTGNPSLVENHEAGNVKALVTTSSLELMIRLSNKGADIESLSKFAGSACDALTGVLQWFCDDGIFGDHMYHVDPAAMALITNDREPGLAGINVLCGISSGSKDDDGKITYKDDWNWQEGEGLDDGWFPGMHDGLKGIAVKVEEMISEAKTKVPDTVWSSVPSESERVDVAI